MLSSNQTELKILRLHFVYVTLILILAIILLATINWTGVEGFTDYLTAAGTMVSIVLGVLAIIYSFVSGDSISRSLGSVAAAAQELQVARSEFSSIVIAASELTTVSQKSSIQLEDLVGDVRIEVQELRAASTQINLSTEGIAKAIEQMPERFDKIDIALEQSMKGKKPEGEGDGAANIETLKKMIDISSSYGKALLYAAALGSETGKPISLHQEPFKVSAEYCYGFLSGADAAYVLNYKLEDAELLKFKIDGVPMSSKEVLEYLYPTMEAEQRAKVEELVSQVDKYFAELQ